MWARILSFFLLLFVAYTTAESPVSLGHGCTIQGAFDAMGGIFNKIEGALSAFSTNIDVHHAMIIKGDIEILGKQMKDAVACIPAHLDGKWVCDEVNRGLPVVTGFLENMMARKDDFRSIGLTAEMCRLLKNLVSNSDKFDRKFIAAVRPSTRICTDQYYIKIGEQLQQAFGTFC
ncbi:hypothetical protein IW262DRAFT_1297758 [Armillaria fumosa]|nr:hypothetical protein IW262DRAFT_1297758 [Armillaria fumosa]